MVLRVIHGNVICVASSGSGLRAGYVDAIARGELADAMAADSARQTDRATVERLFDQGQMAACRDRLNALAESTGDLLLQLKAGVCSTMQAKEYLADGERRLRALLQRG